MTAGAAADRAEAAFAALSPRDLGRRTRELMAFAERRGLDAEAEAVREALCAIERHCRAAELEAEAAA